MDLDWDEKAFPAVSDIYRAGGEIIHLLPKVKASLVVHLRMWIKKILSHPGFDRVFDVKMPPTAHAKLIKLLSDCASELLDVVIYDIVQGVVDSSLTHTIAAACLSIAVKLFGAYDWIHERLVFPVILELSGGNVDAERLNLMEKDILARTDWQGCKNIAGLDEELFDELDRLFAEEQMQNEMTEADYQRMLKKAKKMVRSDLKALRKSYGIYSEQPTLRLLWEKGVWYLQTESRKKLGVDTFVTLGIKVANVSVEKELMKQIIKDKKQNAKKWLIERVLQYGFELRDVHLLA